MSQPLKNPRHEAFCRHYVKHGVGRHAYVAAGYKASTEPQENAPADNCASRLLRTARVSQRIQELRIAMAKRQDINEDSLIDELEEARQVAKGVDNAGAMVQATMGKAKLAGLLIERKEVGEAGEFARMSREELEAYIRDNAPTPTMNSASPKDTDTIN